MLTEQLFLLDLLTSIRVIGNQRTSQAWLVSPNSPPTSMTHSTVTMQDKEPGIKVKMSE